MCQLDLVYEVLINGKIDFIIWLWTEEKIYSPHVLDLNVYPLGTRGLAVKLTCYPREPEVRSRSNYLSCRICSHR